MNFFRVADKNRSNTLTKRECRDLLANTLHVKMPDPVFEQMFKVSDASAGDFAFHAALRSNPIDLVRAFSTRRSSSNSSICSLVATIFTAS